MFVPLGRGRYYDTLECKIYERTSRLILDDNRTMYAVSKVSMYEKYYIGLIEANTMCTVRKRRLCDNELVAHILYTRDAVERMMLTREVLGLCCVDIVLMVQERMILLYQTERDMKYVSDIDESRRAMDIMHSNLAMFQVCLNSAFKKELNNTVYYHDVIIGPITMVLWYKAGRVRTSYTWNDVALDAPLGIIIHWTINQLRIKLG